MATEIKIYKDLTKGDGFTVSIGKGPNGNDWKCFRSATYNWNFDLGTGYFERWGATENEDPEMSPYGPEIADIELTTICSGVSGKLCSYCYKSNTPNGKNMTLDTLKKVIAQVNWNNQLTQVAFGLGSTAEENPELWDMCEYLHANYVVPNGTVAQVDHATAYKIAKSFGAVAISYHNDFDVLANTVLNLRLAQKSASPALNLRQINIHFMIAEETYEDCIRLFEHVKTDPRYEGLNAIVLLGLKQCGRAKSGFTKLSYKKFKTLVEMAFAANIGLGFDSCSASKFEDVAKQIFSGEQLDEVLQMIEPCESGLFSSFVNVDGRYFHCSFE